jgi:hypothetical protein
MAIRIKKADREQVRSLYTKAVRAQVEVYNALAEFEDVTGHLSGLDDYVRAEASDWMNPEDVKINDETLNAMLATLKRER